VLSALFLRGDFRDPALQGLNVTVTEVRLSPDLRNATAFVTPLGGEQCGEAIKALRHAAGFLRGMVAKELNLRFAPTLTFQADISFDEASRVDRLLQLPDVARDLGKQPIEQDTINDDAEEPEGGA
jgi:ribosome-binding factor A